MCRLQVSGLLFFLFLGSCLFLIYLLAWLRRQPYAHPGHSSHAPAFLRNGALVFGLGTLTLYILNLIEMLLQPAECHSGLSKLNTFLAVVFVGLSMVTVIFLPRLNLYVGWGGPHFGLMHLVATNVIAWIWHVLKVSQLIFYGIDCFLTFSGVDARVPGGEEEEQGGGGQRGGGGGEASWWRGL